MKKTDHNELLLFNNFKNGKERAFEYFYNKYYSQILGFNIQFLHIKEEAKGITQEAFINLWLNKDKILTPQGVESFLYTFFEDRR